MEGRGYPFAMVAAGRIPADDYLSSGGLQLGGDVVAVAQQLLRHGAALFLAHRLQSLQRLKTGRLFAASVGLGLWAAEVPAEEQASWRAFGEELGPLFQVVDDLLDGDGIVERVGAERARRLADEAAERARAALERVDGDTSLLRELVDGLAVRTS